MLKVSRYGAIASCVSLFLFTSYIEIVAIASTGIDSAVLTFALPLIAFANTFYFLLKSSPLFGHTIGKTLSEDVIDLPEQKEITDSKSLEFKYDDISGNICLISSLILSLFFIGMSISLNPRKIDPNNIHLILFYFNFYIVFPFYCITSIYYSITMLRKLKRAQKSNNQRRS